MNILRRKCRQRKSMKTPSSVGIMLFAILLAWSAIVLYPAPVLELHVYFPIFGMAGAV